MTTTMKTICNDCRSLLHFQRQRNKILVACNIEIRTCIFNIFKYRSIIKKRYTFSIYWYYNFLFPGDENIY